MSEVNMKKYYPSAFVLYINFFIHGIGASILGQYKEEFAAMWGSPILSDGSYDVSSVVLVIAALGLGRLITLPFSGPISDKFGRKISTYIGMGSYIIYFIGIVFSPNMYVAYALALVGGAANSFLDTGVIPACMEIFVGKSGFASIMTKLFVSLGQFALPVMLGFVAARNMSFRTLFILMAVLLVVVAVILLFMPLPEKEDKAEKKEVKKEKEEKIRFTPESIALIAIGFTCTSTFQLWLNCNQEFGKFVGMEDPSIIQSYYSIGTIIAVLLTAVLVSKWVKAVRFLFLYPLIAMIMLIIVYVVRTPEICLIGGFVVGYSAAGGVLQLATATINDMFPFAKGKITSFIMMASSVANYAILSLAGIVTKAGGVDGPRYVILLNIGVTVIGVLLALFVNIRYKKSVQA